MTPAPLKRVLFVCIGNSCRSQMAEGFLRHFKGHLFDVRSAGTDPKPQIHPLALRVMDEIGLSISAQSPKHTREFLGRLPVKHLLIVCGNTDATCPRIWPGTFSRTFMPFDDPADATGSEAEQLAVFRRVRDEIDHAIRKWVPEDAGSDA